MKLRSVVDAALSGGGSEREILVWPEFWLDPSGWTTDLFRELEKPLPGRRFRSSRADRGARLPAGWSSRAAAHAAMSSSDQSRQLCRRRMIEYDRPEHPVSCFKSRHVAAMSTPWVRWTSASTATVSC